MKKRNGPTTFLAIVGTVLVWLPILAPVLLTTATFASERIFRFDYLMPAELFPVALVGGALLFWAARRAHLYQQVIGWGLGTAIVSLVGGQGLALVTGLATGETRPGGWQWAIVLASLFLYTLGLLALAIGGILLLRARFTKNGG